MYTLLWIKRVESTSFRRAKKLSGSEFVIVSNFERSFFNFISIFLKRTGKLPILKKNVYNFKINKKTCHTYRLIYR